MLECKHFGFILLVENKGCFCLYGTYHKGESLIGACVCVSVWRGGVSYEKLPVVFSVYVTGTLFHRKAMFFIVFFFLFFFFSVINDTV